MKILTKKSIRLETEAEGPKFLSIGKINGDKSLETLSPFLLKRVIDQVTGEIPISAKKTRDGKILVQTNGLTQAKKLIKLTQINENIQVKVTLHSPLNQCKGVVWYREFKHITDEEALEELRSQGVAGIKRMRKREPANPEKEYETGVYILSFDMQSAPKTITCGYDEVSVREYTDDPKRCFKCLRFGHVQGACQEPEKLCGNCGEGVHVNWQNKEICRRPKKCVICQSEEHGSFSKDCPAFKKEKKILDIEKEDKVDSEEARRRYRARYQKGVFPSVLDNMKQGEETEDRDEEKCQKETSRELQEKCELLEKVVSELQKKIIKQSAEVEKRETKETNESRGKKIKEVNEPKNTSGSNKTIVVGSSSEENETDKEDFDLATSEIGDREKELKAEMDAIAKS